MPRLGPPGGCGVVPLPDPPGLAWAEEGPRGPGRGTPLNPACWHRPDLGSEQQGPALTPAGPAPLTGGLGNPERARGGPLLGQALLSHAEAFTGEHRCLPAGRPGPASPRERAPAQACVRPGRRTQASGREPPLPCQSARAPAPRPHRVQEEVGQATRGQQQTGQRAPEPRPAGHRLCVRGAGHPAGRGPGAELEVRGHSQTS